MSKARCGVSGKRPAEGPAQSDGASAGRRCDARRTGFYAEGPDEQAVSRDTLPDDYQSDREQTCRPRDDRWMMVVYRRLPGDGRVGLWTDITALKRIEAERRRLETQLHPSQAPKQPRRHRS